MPSLLRLRRRPERPRSTSVLQATPEKPSPRHARIMQMMAELGGDDPHAAADEARRSILSWLAARWRDQLPGSVWRGEAFALTKPGYYAGGIAFEADGLQRWALRYDHPDVGVAGRSWSAEAVLEISQESATLKTRLSSLTIDSSLEDALSVPGFMLQLEATPGLFDGEFSIDAMPWLIKDNEGVVELVELLLSPARQLPVVVASTMPGAEVDSSHLPCAIDIGRLARLCVGLAHVVVLPQELTFLLSDRIGQDHSVYLGALRTYLPRFKPGEDAPSIHKFATARTVDRYGGPDAYLGFLQRQLHHLSVRNNSWSTQYLAFNQLKSMKLEHEREQLLSRPAPVPALGEHLQAEIELLKRARDEEQSSAEYFASAAATLENGNQDLRDQIMVLERDISYLRERNDSLSRHLAHAGVDPDMWIEFPERFDNIGYWCDKHLAGRLVLMPRASREAQASPCQHVKLTYQALLLLAKEYRDMRLPGEGGLEKKQRFEARLQSLELQCAPTHAGAAWGKYADDYVVRLNDGRKMRLDMHLKKGGQGNFDQRYLLRVYFSWDDRSSQVIVGWLPSHLRTEQSN